MPKAPRLQEPTLQLSKNPDVRVKYSLREPVSPLELLPQIVLKEIAEKMQPTSDYIINQKNIHYSKYS